MISEDNFSKDSNVTLIITSCGRLDLLKRTIVSFFKFNTYPIKKLIITEDSAKDDILNLIKPSGNIEIIINNPKLGQVKSIDLAYSMVDTDYIFHCEDDWEFYRPGFIEDSISILKSEAEIYQVKLRSYYHETRSSSFAHKVINRELINNLPTYEVVFENENWKGFSWNPGLRRLSDYKKINGGYSSLVIPGKNASNTESNISTYVHNQGFRTVNLENDAVAHIGDDRHVRSKTEIRARRFRKTKDLLITLTILLLLLYFLFK